MTLNVSTTEGTWVLIIPTDGLIINNAVKGELKVYHVTFVDKNKLPRIRKRFGIPYPISYYKNKNKNFADFFEKSRTFAVIRRKGQPANIKVPCLRLVQDELSILCLSQLGYSKRRFNSYPRIQGFSPVGHLSCAFLNKDNKTWMMSNWLKAKP